MKFLLILALTLANISSYGQCPIAFAVVQKDYKHTSDTLSGGLTKLVQSKWLTVSQKSSLQVELYYKRIVFADYGMNQGNINFNFQGSGKIYNGKVYFEDGTTSNFEPYYSSLDNVTNDCLVSIQIRGFEFEFDDVKRNGNWEQHKIGERLLAGAIDFSRVPKKLVFLSDRGTIEVVMSDEIFLKIMCVFQRYTTPQVDDIQK